MKGLIISKKIKITYPKDRRITVRRHPTEKEIKKGFSKHKYLEEEKSSRYNEITVKLYNKLTRTLGKEITGGVKEIAIRIPDSTFINIRLTNADDELRRDINDISYFSLFSPKYK